MKYIEKKEENEPEALKAFKQENPNRSFKGLFTLPKKALKTNLLKEQGYLCAYCMCHIDESNTSIEHYLPQSQYPELSLEYHNLLAVCDGNQGNGKHLLQCDKKKSNKLLTKADPRRHEIEKEIFYTINGAINAMDDDFENDLNTLLNLNNQRMVENRRVIIDAIIQFVQVHVKSEIRKEYKKWQNLDDAGYFMEYSQVGVYFLKKYLNQKN